MLGVVVHVWGVVVRRGSLSSVCGMMPWGVRYCLWVAWSSIDGELPSMGVGSSSSKVVVGHGWGEGGRRVLQMVVGCQCGTPSGPHHLVVVLFGCCYRRPGQCVVVVVVRAVTVV